MLCFVRDSTNEVTTVEQTFAEFLKELLEVVVFPAAIALLMWAVAAFRRWVDMKVVESGAKITRGVIDEAVQAAEQLYGSVPAIGKNKMEFAERYVAERVTGAVRPDIEAAVWRLNNETFDVGYDDDDD